MRVIYTLRKGVTWHDGTPFTASDLVFSQRVESDRGLPYPQTDSVWAMESSEAPDASTFVLYFTRPYYLGGLLGSRVFQPIPRHILEAPFERYLATKNADEIVNLPFWTSQYVGTGPFRLTSFDPGAELVFQAYDGYYLGRPKVDFIRVRIFADQNALFSSLLAGAADVFTESTLNPDLGFQLKDRWDADGQGSVFVKQGFPRLLAPQYRPSVLTEGANLDPRVRAALYRAIDREALTEGLQAGHRELAAWELLPRNDPYFEAARDAFRPYAYNPDRAKTDLADLGWTPGPDGVLRHSSDGRRFHNAISAVDNVAREVPAFADYWRRIGVETEEIYIPGAQVRNLELRALYPSWEATGQSPGDGIFGKLDGPAASAQTRWVGNRGGYDDPTAQRLVDNYRAGLSDREQAAAVKAISDFVAADLPFLMLYYTADPIGVRKGFTALSDQEAGDGGGRPWGTYTRNAYLWDVQ
jgi:peptide/nickel transport system substrate-binding protein